MNFVEVSFSWNNSSFTMSWLKQQWKLKPRPEIIILQLCKGISD